MLPYLDETGVGEGEALTVRLLRVTVTADDVINLPLNALLRERTLQIMTQ